MSEKPCKDDSIKLFLLPVLLLLLVLLVLLLLDACIEITVTKEKKKPLLLLAYFQFRNVEGLFTIDENLEMIYVFLGNSLSEKHHKLSISSCLFRTISRENISLPFDNVYRILVCQKLMVVCIENKTRNHSINSSRIRYHIHIAEI